MGTCTHTHGHMHTHTWAHARTHIGTCTHTHGHMHTHMGTCTHTHGHMHTHTWAHAHTHTHGHMHTHTWTHAHTHTEEQTFMFYTMYISQAKLRYHHFYCMVTSISIINIPLYSLTQCYPVCMYVLCLHTWTYMTSMNKLTSGGSRKHSIEQSNTLLIYTVRSPVTPNIKNTAECPSPKSSPVVLTVVLIQLYIKFTFFHWSLTKRMFKHLSVAFDKDQIYTAKHAASIH